jgi:uroporphyrinogen decarboxylase
MSERLQIPPTSPSIASPIAELKTGSDPGHMTGGTRFVRACLRKPVDRTPVWFLRQAGRYMPEYQAVRRHHTLLEICK